MGRRAGAEAEAEAEDTLLPPDKLGINFGGSNRFKFNVGKLLSLAKSLKVLLKDPLHSDSLMVAKCVIAIIFL